MSTETKTETTYWSEKERMERAGYRAFEGTNGWYVARQNSEGSHGQENGYAKNALTAWHQFVESHWEMEIAAHE